MSTKILFNGNRIIFDGHADTAEECRAITAMCDSLAANENFRTVVYEKGHAVFEQVSGGESEMFSTNNYVLLSTYNTKMTDLDGKDLQFLNWFGAYDAAEGTVEARLDALEGVAFSGGINLAGYLTKTEAAETYAPKTDLDAAMTQLEGMITDLAARLSALEAILPATAEVGQYLKVSAVDENGKIAALEAVDMTGGSSVDLSNYVTKDIIGTLPEDTTIVGYVDEKTNLPEYKLPYTGTELVKKLSEI